MHNDRRLETKEKACHHQVIVNDGTARFPRWQMAEPKNNKYRCEIQKANVNFWQVSAVCSPAGNRTYLDKNLESGNGTFRATWPAKKTVARTRKTRESEKWCDVLLDSKQRVVICLMMKICFSFLLFSLVRTGIEPVIYLTAVMMLRTV